MFSKGDTHRNRIIPLDFPNKLQTPVLGTFLKTMTGLMKLSLICLQSMIASHCAAL